MEIINRCELCGLFDEELNIRERDDNDGRPHLICESCWNYLLQDNYEPTEQDFYDMEVAKEMIKMGKKTSLLKVIIDSNTGATYEARKDALTTKLNTHIIDTCLATDTDQWETGIEPIGDTWVIVEQYKNKKEAIKGHKKWVQKLKENSKIKLKDTLEYGL